jgi:hypothetical protein
LKINHLATLPSKTRFLLFLTKAESIFFSKYLAGELRPSKNKAFGRGKSEFDFLLLVISQTAQ